MWRHILYDYNNDIYVIWKFSVSVLNKSIKEMSTYKFDLEYLILYWPSNNNNNKQC